MDYANFCTVAAHARKVRTEKAALALLEVYAEWKCAVYPADVKLFTALWGGMPAGWAWSVYHAGHGGFTDIRREPIRRTA